MDVMKMLPIRLTSLVNLIQIKAMRVMNTMKNISNAVSQRCLKS
jgi:hypothetical protein